MKNVWKYITAFLAGALSISLLFVNWLIKQPKEVVNNTFKKIKNKQKKSEDSVIDNNIDVINIKEREKKFRLRIGKKRK